MIGRYAKLDKDWSLRGWTDVPLAIANWVTGDVRPLSKKGFYAIASCDGRTDFDSLAFLPEHHAILDELIREGIVETCRQGDSIELYQHYRKADNPRLPRIDWCVTGLCNLVCRHCFMESPSRRYGEPSIEEITRLVGEFERANLIQVSLTGGEPFFRADILEILALLAAKKIGLSQIYSNGVLITGDHLRAVRSMGFRPSFQISFDGVGAHDRMRGVAGIETDVIESIRRILAAGFPVVVATCIDRLNIDRLADTYELVKGLGVFSWRISVPQKSGNWRGAVTDLSLDETARACGPLLERWIREGQPFYIQIAGLYSGVPGSEPSAKGEPKSPNYTPEDYDCRACREQPNLLPDGTLVPCPGYVDSDIQERMPNLLRDTGLSEAWSHSLLRDIADMKKRDVLAQNPECAACELFRDCGMGCRTSGLTATGDLLAKDPVACELWRKEYRKLFRSIAEMTSREHC